ncbi:MAG: hypothetical protein AB7I50_21190 [Vicinamibacterales bacterium]
MTGAELIAGSGFSAVDFMNVDIEGAECDLLTSNATWLDKVKVLAVEFNGSADRLTAGIESLRAAGFLVGRFGHTAMAWRPRRLHATGAP